MSCNHVKPVCLHFLRRSSFILVGACLSLHVTVSGSRGRWMSKLNFLAENLFSFRWITFNSLKNELQTIDSKAIECTNGDKKFECLLQAPRAVSFVDHLSARHYTSVLLYLSHRLEWWSMTLSRCGTVVNPSTCSFGCAVRPWLWKCGSPFMCITYSW